MIWLARFCRGVFVVAVEAIADRLFGIFPFASVHVLVSRHCRVDDFDELQELGAAMAPLELAMTLSVRCPAQQIMTWCRGASSLAFKSPAFRRSVAVPAGFDPTNPDAGVHS